MKNPFIAFILAFCALFAACQPAKNEAPPSPLVTTLKNTKKAITKQNEQLLDNLQETVEIRKNFFPLYELSTQLYENTDLLNNDIDLILAMGDSSTFDYPALFQKYNDFCQLAKDSLYALQTHSIPGFFIKKDKIDTLFAHSPLGKLAQKPLSKADFEQLKGEDLQVYWLTLQLDLLIGLNDIMMFLGNNIPSRGLHFFSSIEILSSTEKPIIFLGEEYVSEIMIAPYYQKPIKFELKIDNDSLPTRWGEAMYRHRPNKIGTQTYSAHVQYTNPETGKIEQTTQQFFYEVLPPKANKKN